MKYRFNYALLFILCLININIMGFDFTKDKIQRFYDTEDGLPSAYVADILESKDGFIWLATLQGLVRFDGNAFDVYNVVNTNSLNYEDFQAVLELDDGALLIGSYMHGLYRFENEIFTKLNLGNSIKSEYITKIKEIDNVIYVCTNDGLYTTDGRTASLLNPKFDKKSIYDIHIDSKNNLYAGIYAEGLIAFNNEFEVIEEMSFRQSEFSNIRELSFLSNTGLIVGTQSGLFRISENQKIERLKDYLDVQDFYKVNEDYLLIGTEDGVYKLKNGIVKKSDEFRFPDNRIRDIFMDSRGDYWFGTYNGLATYIPRIIKTISEENGLSNDFIRSMIIDSKENVWLGTIGGGLFKYNSSMAKAEYQTDLPFNNIHSIFEDKNGRIWVGLDGHLAKIDDDKIEVFSSSNIEGLVIRDIIEIENDLILATNTGMLLRFNNGRFEKKFKSENQSLVFKMLLTPKHLWVATITGIYKINKNDFSDYQYITKDEGLPSNDIQYIYEDKQGVLFFTNNFDGLIKYENNVFTSYTKKDGLFSNDGWTIIEDDKGHLWISCDEGLYSIAKDELKKYDNGEIDKIRCINFNEYDGMLNRECNGGAQSSAKDKDGNLWFQTIGGAVYFNPDSLLGINDPIEPYISHVLIDDERIPFTNNITVPADNDNFQIHFGALYFGNKSRLSFRYKISGLQENWIYLKDKPVIYIPHVPTGQYTIVLQANNKINNWADAETIFTFYHEAHFYETLVFKVIVGFISLIMIIVFIHFRGKNYQRKNELLSIEIEKRNKAENELQESEYKLKSLMDNSFQYSGLLDNVGRVIIANKTALREMGIELDYVKGKLFWETPWWQHSSELQEKLRGWINDAINGIDSINEVTHYIANGNKIIVNFKIKPIYGNNNEVIYLLVEGQDITELKLAESNTRESEEKYRILAENVSDLIAQHNTAGEFIFVSPSCKKILGYSPDYLIGKNPLSLVHPEEEELLKDSLQKTLKEEKSNVSAFRIMKNDGSYIWMETYSQKIPGREPIEFISSSRDISWRMAIESELKNSVEFVEYLINTLPITVISTDLNSNVKLKNSEADKYRNDEVAKSSYILDVFPKLGFLKDFLDDDLNEKDYKNEKIVHKNSSDELEYYNVSIYFIVTSSGPGKVFMIEDVTEKTVLQQLMVQSEKMKSIAGLAAGMAHEINNPLGSIAQGCQNIKRRTDGNLSKNLEVADSLGLDFELLKEYFEKRQIFSIINSLQLASEKASEIIKNMLKFSRNNESDKYNVDISELMEESIEIAYNDYDMKKKYDIRTIDINKTVEDGLPNLSVNPNEIVQVFFNILRNAVQAINENANNDIGRINISIKKSDKYLNVSISDNGNGIPETIKNRIFEPFFTTKEIGTGTGLGLSVSYTIITKNHNGKMSFTSEEGVGTTFNISLPLN